MARHDKEHPSHPSQSPTKKNWLTVEVRGDFHIIPVKDLIDHTYEDCICGPTTTLLDSPADYDVWMNSHHALDGRK